MTAKHVLSTLALAASLALPSLTRADTGLGNSSAKSSITDSFNLTTVAPPTDGQSNASPEAAATKTVDQPMYLDDAPQAPNIHGFFNSPFKTAYVTPRGLVVENAGLVWQPVLGLVFPIGDLGVFKNFTVVGGIWNSVNTNQQDPYVGAWNETDVFISFSATLAKKFSLNLTYSPWNSPPHAFHTEHNADLKITYDDSGLFGNSGFALKPYVDLWWAISGDSTVILGQRGGTGYIELGVSPSYTCKSIPSYPITFSVPAYISMGPRSYWAASGKPPGEGLKGGNFGLVSISANASVPLSFIPTKYGFWHADAGITYDYLINDTLLFSGTLASGNTNHNVFIGSLGFGVNF